MTAQEDKFFHRPPPESRPAVGGGSHGCPSSNRLATLIPESPTDTVKPHESASGPEAIGNPTRTLQAPWSPHYAI